MTRLLRIDQADTLMDAYARRHGLPEQAVLERAERIGLVVEGGTLQLLDTRWQLTDRESGQRVFTVKVPRRGGRHTLQANTRARLAAGLCELGYTAVEAGRHAYRAWSEGASLTSTGRTIAQEVTS